MSYLLRVACNVSKQTLVAIALLSCALVTSADADSNSNEEIIASGIQRYFQIPDSTSVTVQQCKIEIIVRHSESNNCVRPDSIDYSRTLLPLYEIDEIQIGNAGAGHVALHFSFSSDVSQKLEKAMEIWRGDQISDESLTIDNIEGSSTGRAFEFLRNSNVDYQRELFSCGGVQYFDIRSPFSHFTALRAEVPKEFFYALQEYYSMCKLTNNQ